MLKQIIRHISSHNVTDPIIKINFFEWLFIRHIALAFNYSSGKGQNITSEAVFKMATEVLPSYTEFDS
jgi:hypothetical protein